MKLSTIKTIAKIAVGAAASYGASRIVDGVVDHAMEGQKIGKLGTICVGVAKGAFSAGAGKYASDYVAKLFDSVKIDDEKKTITFNSETEEPAETEETAEPEEATEEV